MAPKGKPASQEFDYFFCRNPNCTYHAMFLLKDKPAELKQGAKCPVCGIEKIEFVKLDTAAAIKTTPAQPVTTGIALPVDPYGGFVLTFGDSDNDGRWEQSTNHPEPQHQGARYVSELQRDLMRLGYYSHGREAAQDKVGEFTLAVVAAVLDLKRHLADVYKLTVVDDIAATKVSGDAPIYYRQLVNPGPAFQTWQSWQQGVNQSLTSVGEFAKRWDASQKFVDPPTKAQAAELKKRDDGYDKLKELVDAKLADVNLRNGQIDNLINRPPTHFDVPLSGQDTYAGERRGARQGVSDLIATSAKAGQGGPLTRLEAKVEELAVAWSGQTPPITPPGWDAYRKKLGELRLALTKFRDSLDDAGTGPKIFNNYREELREYGKVDHGTALAIRQMVWTGVLKNRGVFLLPMDDEIQQPEGAFLGDCVTDADMSVTVGGARVKRTPDNTPIKILEFLFVHESGASHTMGFAGRRYVTLGIDWDNGPKRNKVSFEEAHTRPEQWSASRGWGITQKTYFNTPVPDKDVNGSRRTYEMHGGVPFAPPGDTVRPNPTSIASKKDNTTAGVKVLIGNFDSSKLHRDCSFKTKYACDACTKNLKVTPVGTFDKTTGKFTANKVGPNTVFDVAATEFEPVVVPNQGISDYRMTDPARARALVKDGTYTIPGYDASVADPTPDQLVEWPCSWFFAVLHYAGSGEQAYAYALEAMWGVAGFPPPPKPPPPTPPPQPDPQPAPAPTPTP